MHKKLPVPENIPLRWELWRGFGYPELIRSIIIVAVFLTCGIFFCFASSWPPRKIAVTTLTIFLAFFCAGFFGKMDNNQSIYDYLCRMHSYAKEQQVFWYKRKKEVIRYVSEEREEQ